MDDVNKNGPECNCSFCGKHQEEVEKLIAGPDVYICDECIELCNEIVRDKDGNEIVAVEDEKQLTLKPMEIKKHLDD